MTFCQGRSNWLNSMWMTVPLRGFHCALITLLTYFSHINLIYEHPPSSASWWMYLMSTNVFTFTSCILFCVLLYVICHRCTWPYGVGCVRNYAVTTAKTDETSVAIQSKQAQDFDWALNKLDSSVRRTGRITKTLLLRIFHDICRTGMETQLQSRTCNVKDCCLWPLCSTMHFFFHVFRLSKWQSGFVTAAELWDPFARGSPRRAHTACTPRVGKAARPG